MLAAQDSTTLGSRFMDPYTCHQKVTSFKITLETIKKEDILHRSFKASGIAIETKGFHVLSKEYFMASRRFLI